MQFKKEIGLENQNDKVSHPIQDTQWSLVAESKLRREQLGFTQMSENKFIFSLNKNDERYGYPVSAWAQLVLPNLYIGDYSAVLGNYDTTGKYPKYSLILDFSLMDLNKLGITLSKDNHVFDIGDLGTNFDELKRALVQQQVVEKINAALSRKEKVLINCSAGQSRSATVIIYYLMETYKVSFSQAYRHLHKSRPEACPNPGFVQALLGEENVNALAIPGAKAKPWLLEYIKTKPLGNLVVETEHENETVTLKAAKAANWSSDEFLALVSFMQTLELSFEAINCTKFEASMRMDVKTFNKLTEIFSPKMLSGNVDESSYKSGQTFFDSKGTKEIDNQLDTVENCTIS